MKKATKRLALSTQTIRTLQNDDLAQVQGGSLNPGTTRQTINTTGTTIISTGSSVISTGSSVISGGH